MLTKEQYEKLQPYEKQLNNAVKQSFVNLPGSDFLVIAEIYAEVFQPLTKSQMGCNTCRLNALRKLGELYTQYQKEGNKTPGEEKKVVRKRTKKIENGNKDA